jgi:hypothetical protein
MMAGGASYTHFVHDADAFQLGIGITLLLALAWRDGLALVVAGFLVANATNAISHAVDLDLGGHSGDWGLAALSLLTASHWPCGWASLAGWLAPRRAGNHAASSSQPCSLARTINGLSTLPMAASDRQAGSG